MTRDTGANPGINYEEQEGVHKSMNIITLGEGVVHKSMNIITKGDGGAREHNTM